MQNKIAQIIHKNSALSVPPRKYMDALLAQEDTKSAVSALSPMEFYDLYHGVGAGDAIELLNYCSPEQLQICLDFDTWRNDRLDDRALIPWIESMLAIDDDDQFRELFHEMDPEPVALCLHRNIHLYAAENRDDDVDIPDEESANVAQTPDMTFWIAYPENPEKADILKQLIDRLYIVFGVDKAWSYLEAMSRELDTELEETAYHFRTERIREYGFLPREEAAEIFAACNLEKEAEAVRKTSGEDLIVTAFDQTARFDHAIDTIKSAVADDTWFAKILSSHPDPETIRVQLLSIAQRVAITDGVQPYEEQGIDDSMLLAVCDINIGLEYTSRLNEELAGSILRKVPLKKLFNIGHNVTLELQHKARLLTVRGHLSIVEDNKLSLLTNAQRDCIEGLLEPRPRPASTRLDPFRNMHDIGLAAQVIADIAAREVFFGEAVHKTKDDIARFAYTKEIYIGVENVNFDNVAATWILNKRMKLQEPWRPVKLSEIPSRDAVLNAVSPDSILSLYKSSLDETTRASQIRFAHQLTSAIIDSWPENLSKPDPHIATALVIEDEENI